ncbi:unnamed protein product, partial [Staurois parvus]
MVSPPLIWSTTSTIPRVRISLRGRCGCMDFRADLQRHHPHRCEPSLIEQGEVMPAIHGSKF